jgi:zinc transport system ATP-binding protein
MLGLEKPRHGKVTLLGEAPRRGWKRVGYMPQSLQFDHLFPVNVLDVVLMGRLERRWAGPYRKDDREAAMVALEKVRLSNLAKRGFSQLSGGQRQRVLIARALVCNPEILFLDEPTANVDHAVEEELFEMLSQLGKGLTVVMVTHDLAVVSRLVESVVCVSDRSVHVHPTSELTGDTIQALYGGNVRMILHDHRCGEEGHSHG